ncbi:nitrous oxide reductase accessory protein NosL [Lysinibacillus sp. FJAT-14745]|uniref:nitrous oxide reductase accessory protein NosL n=1 Tax=Lysinibacillus sp. FJAT-14745 TaxID=1704289 RepID=UPI0006AB776F|nr:nitrous oxide reductase accessory protein NosL [Lysinibacillus sp. FJAT-14745]
MKKLFALGIILLSIISVGFIDNKHKMSAEAAKSSLEQDVPDNTNCAFCNMVVYQKKDKMGVFAAQAIKKKGKVVYYDDIGCLLYDEEKSKTKNKKYVRDYKTLKWVQAEKATYVKTSLASPMDDGYIYFEKETDAKKYIAKHSGTKIVPFKTVRKESIEKYQ